MTPVNATAAITSELIFDIALTPIQDLWIFLIDSIYPHFSVVEKTNSESRIEDRNTFAGRYPVGWAHLSRCENKVAQSATGVLSVHWHFVVRLKQQ